MRLNSLLFGIPFFMFNDAPPYIESGEDNRKAGHQGKAYKTGRNQRKLRKLARQTNNY